LLPRETSTRKTFDEEDQALVAQARKDKKGHSSKIGGRRFPDHKKKRDISKIRYFNCNKVGCFASQCTQESNSNDNMKWKGKRKDHAHAVDDDHTSQKKANETSYKEFVFVSARTRTITRGGDVWLIHSGASKHVTRDKSSLAGVKEKDSSLQVELGDNSKHAVKGVGEASYKLDSSTPY